MNAFRLRSLALACGLAGSLPAMAQATLPDGAANALCLYSHTLADDPIVHPNKPGVAMRHDFFGNTKTYAYSTGDDLVAHPGTTCENAADSSAYWAPSLRLADGTIVPPTYKKTYYTNVAVPSNNRYPVSVMPTGLQMLAGNHAGTRPNPRISFLCTGSRKGYTNTIPTDCVPDPVKGTQLNIGIGFPTCWDGNNLAPTLRSHHGGYSNMAYADRSGACPTGYPVRVPHLSMNLAYAIGQVRDLTGAQLSLDPMLDAHGKPAQALWGSLYSAHADFFNGWQPQAIRFMTEYCLNKGRVCSREIPYAYTEPEADTMVMDGEGRHATFGSDIKLATQTESDATPQLTFYLKFPIPAGADTLSPRFKPEYKIMIHGGNVIGTSADTLKVYATDTAWDEQTLSMNNAPACGGKLAGRLYLNHVQQYRTIDVSAAVSEALKAGRKTISFCVKGARPGGAFAFSSKEGDHKPVLFLRALNPLPL
ncbi:DUF1996 domain-containing protein [Cupriavidus campinensis]